ncbi:MAG: C25 family cysteine peptidase [Candidatus Thorarchaeota archaeon]
MKSFSNVKPSITQKAQPMIDVTSQDFPVGRTQRSILEHLLIICGRVGDENIAAYETKANEIGADFVLEKKKSWVFTHRTIKEHYDSGQHRGILLIGTNKELPGIQVSYQGSYAYTDWYFQDADDDNIPDVPVGRIYGPQETVLYHMDPNIIDSNIAVVFDSQPDRSDRHVDGLKKLGFSVQVLQQYNKMYAEILGASEFILQFSDGVFTSRIHGTPEKWASHNSDILTSRQAEKIKFRGYPVVFSEACSTAQEGPLLTAFLNQGAAYIGSTLDTLNNITPFDDWRQCAFADGWKFGFLDLLDSHELIGEVKLGVDRGITENLDESISKEIEAINQGKSSEIHSDEAVSTLEWVLFGNPLRRTTVGPNADYKPGVLIVDT